jgi:membrane protease subunit HflK
MAWNEPGGNDNDPWGNRKNSGGPPDLDEVFKNVRGKIDGLFGKKGPRGSGGGSNGGGSTGFPGGSMGAKGFGVIAGILGVLWLLSGIYIVEPAEAGVVTQFGRHVQTTRAGPHWHIPYPVQSVETINVQEVRTATMPDQLILTQDENLADIKVTVQYVISSAENYLFNVRGPDETLNQVMESALREVIGQTDLEAVLTEGRDLVPSVTRDEMQNVLDSYEAGIAITSVNFEKGQPPAEVQAAFSDVIKAREDRERFINEAQGYSNEIVPRARGDAQRIIEEAQGYRTRVEQAAIGESQRFLSLLTEFEKAPEVTRERLYIEAMETVLSNSNKVLIDSSAGGGSNSLMYLPIDKLIEQGASRQNNTGALSSSGNDSPRFTDLPSRVEDVTRNSTRSRERGALQ